MLNHSPRSLSLSLSLLAELLAEQTGGIPDTSDNDKIWSKYFRRKEKCSILKFLSIENFSLPIELDESREYSSSLSHERALSHSHSLSL